MSHRIQICNYSFVATNGKKITETYKRNRAPLIGETVEQIKKDATGRNYGVMKAHYLKLNKTRKNNNEFKFRILSVEICTHTPDGKELLKESYTNWQ